MIRSIGAIENTPVSPLFKGNFTVYSRDITTTQYNDLLTLCLSTRNRLRGFNWKISADSSGTDAFIKIHVPDSPVGGAFPGAGSTVHRHQNDDNFNFIKQLASKYIPFVWTNEATPVFHNQFHVNIRDHIEKGQDLGSLNIKDTYDQSKLFGYYQHNTNFSFTP